MSDCVEISAPEPVFGEPWHAQVFALTVHMNEAGRFSWGDWVQRFSATLRRHGLDRDLDGGEDYFRAWLETLESYLAEEGAVAPEEQQAMRSRWEAAYLATPHGAVVRLQD